MWLFVQIAPLDSHFILFHICWLDLIYLLFNFFFGSFFGASTFAIEVNPSNGQLEIDIQIQGENRQHGH